MKINKIWLVTLVITISLSVICGAAQKKSESEPPDFERALNRVRVINTSEVTYAATFKTGFSHSLAAMGEAPSGTKPTSEAAGLIDHKLASSGKAAGYVFNYHAGAKDKDGHISTYTITARPLKPRKGIVSYFSDQTGVLRGTKENRTPTAKDPTFDTLTD